MVVILQSTEERTLRRHRADRHPADPARDPLRRDPVQRPSVNPARTFGPDLVGNVWTGFWIYMIAPPLGAIIAWAVHMVVVKGETSLGADLSPVAREAPSAA